MRKSEVELDSHSQRRLIAMQPTTPPITATQSHFHNPLGSACSRERGYFTTGGVRPETRGSRVTWRHRGDAGTEQLCPGLYTSI
uniref:Uncharacterized protein n=1 Tax=Knipowitschia caucasica TaxID=637954 RepID=A0AAV2MGZ7_KNICA